MTRPHKCRWIAAKPGVTAFKPCGVPGRTLETVELGLDELEAIRLADLEGLYHQAAAEQMGVSRATFGNLLASARHKIAAALLGPKMLMFQGGHTMMRDQRTFDCGDCGKSFQLPFGTGRPEACPSCNSGNIRRAAEPGCCGNRHRGRGQAGRRRGRIWAIPNDVTTCANEENSK